MTYFFAKARHLTNDRRGVVAIIVALMLLPLILATGGAIDFARAYVVKTRLSYALDAAALAVGSADQQTADLNAILSNFFYANFPPEKLGTPTSLSLDAANGIITVSAAAEVETIFLRVIPFHLMDSIDVRAEATIVRETTGLEVVLVLDNSASMDEDGKMDDLKVASQELVETLFAGEAEPEKVKMAIVPFVATVNIGSGNVGYLDVPTPDHEYADVTDSEWKGCVEARGYPHDTRDTYVPGSASQGEWAPYFWEAETYFRMSTSNSFCTNRWWRPTDNPASPPALPRPTGRSGDPPFRDGLGGAGTFEGLDVTAKTTNGPNKACPTPVTPLTNLRTTIDAAIDAMEPWSGGGTMVNLGAVWGWRVLSPEPPFTEGLAWDAENSKKAMIILTDGRSEISAASSLCWFETVISPNANPKYNSHYTSYGYVSENRLGTTSVAAAAAELVDRLAEVCENAKTAGVIIYTITFQVSDSTTQDAFRACASEADNYFNSPSADELSAAFRAIGAELSNLRIAQ